MPSFAILNDKLVKPEDIYKFDIPKNSKFVCYTCDKLLHFRQSRNGDENYTDHFFHVNNVKGTHIECEKPLDTIKDFSSNWHKTISSHIINDNREIVKFNDTGKKHIVDAYDPKTQSGIEFQHSKISKEDIISRENTTKLDWIFNVESQYVRKINIGKFGICEVPNNNWEEAVKVCKNNVYLYTKYKQWLWLKNKKQYHIDIDGKIRNVWICKILSFDELCEQTCLKNILTEDGKKFYSEKSDSIEVEPIIYARCKKSMKFLDKVYRNYVNKHKFKKNDILAIKSVAGSGKTTTLLELAKTHTKKKILYLAFNRCLIQEIRSKITKQKITNLIPKTFDALMRQVFIAKTNIEPYIVERGITPQTVCDVIPWFKGKNYKLREFYSNEFKRFCGQLQYKTVNEYCRSKCKRNNKGLCRCYGYCRGEKKHPLLEKLWTKVLCNDFHTFDSIKKIVQLKRYCNDYIDKKYDMIFIDEAQDFDDIMLSILLTDTTIPKVFVGDPRQAIYEWRGCINAFEKLPETALTIEFYSTFRIGEPACEKIRNKFEDCWMISRSENETKLEEKIVPDTKYVYLFRSWRRLLETAQENENIWINNFDKQSEYIYKLHKKLKISPLEEEELKEFADDLPKFLVGLSYEALDKLMNKIKDNLTTQNKSVVDMYTIHSYKGLENDIIRIADDIDVVRDENLYYVALTRGIKQIIEDAPYEKTEIIVDSPTIITNLQTNNIKPKKKSPKKQKVNTDNHDSFNNTFSSITKHEIDIKTVTKKGGKMEGKYQIRIRGEKVTNKSGVKVIYSEPDYTDVAKKLETFLKIEIL